MWSASWKWDQGGIGDQSVRDEIREVLRGSKCGVQVGDGVREILSVECER